MWGDIYKQQKINKKQLNNESKRNVERIFLFRVKIEYWIGDEILFDSDIYSILEYCVLYFRVLGWRWPKPFSFHPCVEKLEQFEKKLKT